MLRHSYKVELKRVEAKILGLKLDLMKNPVNERAKTKLFILKQERNWFKERIESGKDPGVYTL